MWPGPRSNYTALWYSQRALDIVPTKHLWVSYLLLQCHEIKGEWFHQLKTFYLVLFFIFLCLFRKKNSLLHNTELGAKSNKILNDPMTQMKRVMLMFRGSNIKLENNFSILIWIPIVHPGAWTGSLQSNLTLPTWLGKVWKVGFKQNCCCNANCRVMFLWNFASLVVTIINLKIGALSSLMNNLS